MLQPADEAELCACLAECTDAVEIVGGGSKRAVGGRVDAAPLSVAAMQGIVDYRPEELIVTARAATSLVTLQQALREANQRLAFEPGTLPGSTGPQTIGGVLAANLSGSRRVTAGAARDHFLGLRAVNGQGLAFKAGGKVVKNVTGYDLPKLLAGSWGTLAVLTEVTLRAVPAPEHECTWVVGERDVDAAVALMTRALGSPHDVSSAAFDPARGEVFVRLEGFAPSVAARLAALRAEASALIRAAGKEPLEGEASRALWQTMGSAGPVVQAPVVWRLSVPPADAVRVVRAIAPACWLLDWGGGLIWIGADTVDAVRVRGALRDGHATLIKAPDAERAMAAVFPPQAPAVAALAARVKAAFDPLNRLNPGRMR
jgi:glycolate oxidase FAD binding subunit